MRRKESGTAGSENARHEVNPELDDAWFEEADAFVGTRLVRRGRPRSSNPKQPVSLRLDSDVLEWFRNQGSGWQTRINDELRKVAGL
jgi:uncharacterized protein (DUF4415 family)